MKRRLVDFSMNHPKAVIGLVLAVTVLLGLQIPKVVIDTDPENMLPEDEAVRVFHSEVEDVFGLHDMLVLGIVREEGVFNPATLARVARITDRIREMDGVIADDLLAPGDVDDIRTTADGMLRVETLMEEPPKTDEGAERILAQIGKNPVLRGKLASDDGKAMAIFIPLESKDVAHSVAVKIEKVLEEEKGDEEFHLAGMPLAQDTFGAEMFRQMVFSAPAAFLVIFLLLFFFFRNFAVVLAPMIVAVISVTWTMGLLIGLGYTVHIMSSMIPIFLIPIAVLNSIHILSEFHERYPRHREMRRTIRETMDELFVPMIFTSLTTVVGFASLVLTPIPPVQVFGAFVAFGIAAAWFLSVVFNIAYAVLLPEKAIRRFGSTEEGGGLMRRIMHFIRGASLRFNKPVVAGGILLLAASVVGLTRIQVNDNPVKWFKAGHPLRVADEVMNRHLAGTYLAYLSVESDEEGGLKDPGAMRYIESLQARLDDHPNVGATTSIADIVKKVRGELKEDPSEAIVPDSREEIAQYLFLYEMSGGNPEDLFKFITPEADRANIWVQMHRGENREVSSVVAAASGFLSENPPPGLSAHWAGMSYINVIWQKKMVNGMMKALLGSFAVVLLMMIFLFRSARLGILSVIPLSATIALVYGFIGFSGRPYDMPVAVLSSLTLGLSIDFAIHFLQRSREIYRSTGDFGETMRGIFEAPSRAIARNVLVIAIGFVPMFFANLVPYITVGAFFFAIMVISGITTFFAFPAILSLMSPAFLAGKAKRNGLRGAAPGRAATTVRS
ncbi:MAG: MMPL family transporter [Candidatus Eisenbacteria bacterium]